MITKESIDKLTVLLALPATGTEQDWDVELADPNRIDEFVEAYLNDSLSSADRFALMALMLASVDEFVAEHDRVPPAWAQITKLLGDERVLHSATMAYWRRDGEEDPECWFHLTPYVRALSKT